MPHVIVKLWPGKSETQKSELARAIAENVRTILDASDRSVSVSIEEVAPDQWMEEVYRPEIADKPDALYKKPGYDAV